MFPAGPHLQQCFVSKSHDALKDNDVCTIQSFLQRNTGSFNAQLVPLLPTLQPKALGLTQSFFRLWVVKS